MTLPELQLHLVDAENSLTSSVTTDHETLKEIIDWMKGVQAYLDRKERERGQS